ncbi:MAG: hypothetical protein ACK58J_12870, partial [Planctomyces sp.]
GDTSSLDDELARQMLLPELRRLQEARRLKAVEGLQSRYPQVLPDDRDQIQQDLTAATEHADAALQELKNNNPALAAVHLNNSLEYSCDLVWLL